MAYDTLFSIILQFKHNSVQWRINVATDLHILRFISKNPSHFQNQLELHTQNIINISVLSNDSPNIKFLRILSTMNHYSRGFIASHIINTRMIRM